MDSISSLEYHKQIANYLNRAWKDKFEDKQPSWKNDISNFWLQNRRLSRKEAAGQLSYLLDNFEGKFQGKLTKSRPNLLKPHQYLALSKLPPWEHLFFLGLLQI